MKSKFSINIYFFLWVFSIYSIFLLAFLYLPKNGIVNKTFFESLANWDGEHFLNIAQSGYFTKNATAFFPLYPLLIKAFSYIAGNFLLSALLISIVSFYFSLHIFYRLVSLEFNSKIAQKSILVLLIFPTSFFFLVSYSESLFLVLTLLTFYFAKKEKYFYAAIFCSLATTTRISGLALVVALIIDLITKRKLKHNLHTVLFSLTGFLTYCLFLYSQTGNPFYFVKAEINWGRQFNFPWISFWNSLRLFYFPDFLIRHLNFFWDLIFAVFGLGIILRGFRFLPLGYSMYALISLATPLFTSTLLSIPRFLIAIFPIFITLSLIKNRIFIISYVVISISLLIIYSCLFINGYWVS